MIINEENWTRVERGYWYNSDVASSVFIPRERLSARYKIYICRIFLYCIILNLIFFSLLSLSSKITCHIYNADFARPASVLIANYYNFKCGLREPPPSEFCSHIFFPSNSLPVPHRPSTEPTDEFLRILAALRWLSNHPNK